MVPDPRVHPPGTGSSSGATGGQRYLIERTPPLSFCAMAAKALIFLHIPKTAGTTTICNVGSLPEWKMALAAMSGY